MVKVVLGKERVHFRNTFPPFFAPFVTNPLLGVARRGRILGAPFKHSCAFNHRFVERRPKAFGNAEQLVVVILNKVFFLVHFYGGYGERGLGLGVVVLSWDNGSADVKTFNVV